MPKCVVMLLAQGFELLEAAAFTDVLGWADIVGSERLELVTAGCERHELVTTGSASPVATTFGFKAVPQTLVADVDPASFDALVIPGDFASARFVDAPIVADGAILTSTGHGTATEIALAFLAILTTQQNAEHVRGRMRIPHPDAAWFATPQVAA